MNQLTRTTPLLLALALSGAPDPGSQEADVAAPALPWSDLVSLAELPEAIQAQVRAAEREVLEAPEDVIRLRDLGELYLGYRFSAAGAACFARAAELQPTEACWPYYAALSHRKAYDIPAAVAALQRALAIDETYAPFHVELAELLIEDDLERAASLYRRACELDANLATAQLGLGRCEALNGHTDAATALFQRAIELAPRYSSAHYELAMILRESGRLDEAAEHLALYEEHGAAPLGGDPLREALVANMKDPPKVKARVLSLWESGGFDEARAFLAAQLELTPDRPTLRDLLAHTFLREGRLEEAAAQFRAILDQNPGYIEAHANLAQVLQELGRHDEAEGVLRAALERHPESGAVLHRLALLLSASGRGAEALGLFGRAVEAQPASSQLRADYGRVLAAAGQHKQAIEELRAAHETGPGSAESHLLLGDLLHRIGDVNAAQLEWLAGTELGADARVYLDLASRAMGEGRYGFAGRLLRRGSELVPKSARIRAQLAWLLATSPLEELRDAPEAIRLAEQVCNESGWKKPEFVDALAAAYAADGKFEKAIYTEREAIDLARAARKKPLLGVYQERLSLYLTSQPYRQPAPPPARR